jgi:hypothetical protein
MRRVSVAASVVVLNPINIRFVVAARPASFLIIFDWSSHLMKSVTHKLFNVPAGRYGLTELAKLLGEEPSVILGQKLSKLRGRVIGKNTLAIDAAGRFREFIFEPNSQDRAPA